jgi:hypothetical protein
MTESSTGDTQPVAAESPTSSNRVFLMTLLIGILMGIVIMTLFGYGLYFFGYISILDDGAQSTVHVTEVKIPICPTCEPGSETPDVIVVTPTLSPTPDYGATATSACGSFNEQFPGTPCPTLSNP